MAKKYIDADKLIKAIEEKGLDCSFALKMERLDTLALIDELQREQPEVDFEKEIAENLGDVWNDTPVEVKQDMIKYARHFYKLGFNASKEE